MCGIMAYIGQANAVFETFMGMEKLEYRGYDSAGLCFIQNNSIHLVKQAGSVSDLIMKINNDYKSPICIGHTRWATHGKPSRRNAHPHVTEDNRLAIVHNGIIENAEVLKLELIQKGYKFLSDTDTEILLYLIYDYFMNNTADLFDSVRIVLKRVIGAYAFILIDRHDDTQLICAKKGSPMVIGKEQNTGNYYVSSDVIAFPEDIDRVIYPKDCTVMRIRNEIESFDIDNGKIQDVNIEKLSQVWTKAEKGSFNYFMQKEIYEQPVSVRNAMAGRIDGYRIIFGGLSKFIEDIKKSSHITIVACGTSYNAGLLGKYYIEEFTNKKVSVEYASEFRYRKILNLKEGDVVLGISQSGETADVIEALKRAQRHKCKIIGLCNTVNSTVSRLTDTGVYIKAGLEVGVASTKAFTNQAICLLMFSLWIQQNCDQDVYTEIRKRIITGLRDIDDNILKVLHLDTQIEYIAKKYSSYNRFLFIGRQYNYPVALEAALKMKEICYNHAEGYAAAELKHGPLALVDNRTVAVVVNNDITQKIKMNSTIQEIKSRGGKIINIEYSKKTTDDMLTNPEEIIDDNIVVPNTVSCLTPIVSVVPLQLLAFYSAIARGKNVDRPRNLAKSVTVE